MQSVLEAGDLEELMAMVREEERGRAACGGAERALLHTHGPPTTLPASIRNHSRRPRRSLSLTHTMPPSPFH